MSERRYYRFLKIKRDKSTIDVWHCSHEMMKKLIKAYDFVLPLDRKPTNCPNIKEG